MALLYASGSSRKATTGLVVRPLGEAAHLDFVRRAAATMDGVAEDVGAGGEGACDGGTGMARGGGVAEGAGAGGGESACGGDGAVAREGGGVASGGSWDGGRGVASGGDWDGGRGVASGGDWAGGGVGGAVSFLQCPSWGAVKSGWEAESLGWYRGTQLVGAGLVLYRWLPRGRRCLAYLPDGPVIDWFGERTGVELADWLTPLVDAMRRRGAFAVKLGPKVISRVWSAQTVKLAMATSGSGGDADTPGRDGGYRRLGDVPGDYVDPRADELSRRLCALGWRRTKKGGDGFTDLQPRYHFRLPLAGRDEEQIGAGFNQQWRRNIRLAERAGVHVACVGSNWLPEFHRLYVETAARDRFTPRPLEYFQHMFDVFDEEDPERIRLYIARRGNEALAAATMVRVGSYAWYSYGASANHGREYRPSNALQWRMIQDCIADGVGVYDLRGIGDSLDPDNHLHGLLRFKLGLGGEAVEYLGEWDFPINPVLYRAFQLYLARR